MKKKPVFKEEWKRLENELAEELLETGREDRDNKYTEVYEKLYSTYPNEKKTEMSKNYLKAAIKHNIILRKLIKTGKSVLDIGCGFGHEAALLAKQGNNVTGIDINRIHIIEAKEAYGHLNNLQFLQTTGVKLAFWDNSFDFVISKSVFEHLHPHDVNDHLSEVKRVLKPHGEYIFTAVTPHARGVVPIIRESPGQREKTGFHINFLTWNQLRRMLIDSGFNANTNILPFRITNKIPNYSFFISLSFKSWLEKNIKMTPFHVRLFKMGNVFVKAKVY